MSPMRKRAPKRRSNLKKRTYNKRPSGPRITRVRALGIPDKMMVKLPYTDLQSYASLFPSFSIQKAYGVNNVWDPEPGVANDSAYALATYANIYQNFRVYKVDYDVMLTNMIADTVVAGSINFSPAGQGPNSLNIQSLSMPFSRPFRLGIRGDGNVRLRGSIYLPKVAGLTNEQYRTNPAYAGLTNGGNPVAQIMMTITGINVNQTVPCNIQAQVKYVAHCELFNRKQILSTQPPDDTPVA